MSIGSDKKIAVILLAMGGPNKTADIPDYLYNIFSDRALIKLPGGPLFQKPLAKIISLARSSKVKARYDLIGGGSPLLGWTQKQADQIEGILSPLVSEIKCVVAMRYFSPYIKTVINEIAGNKYDYIIFLPMYPQYSKATTGSCFDEIKYLKSIADCNLIFINDFHSEENYISLLQEYIKAHKKEDEVLLFSAHSLPQEFIDEGDPYVDQIKTTAKLAACEMEYFVSFQSRTGPVNWVGPDTIETVDRLLDEGKSIFVVPISFVCDHIETLYEIDIELAEKLGKKVAGRIRRMPMFNDDKKFSEVLVSLIKGAIDKNVTA